jgi:putative flippase GtrA
VKRLSRFLIVGALCTVLGMFVIWILTGLFSIHYLVSTALVFVVVNPIGYALNRRFTFGGDSPNWIWQLLKYYTVTAGSLALTLVLSMLLVDGLDVHYLVANALIAIGMVCFNFLSHDEWTFGSRRSRIQNERL